jgi:hypothetical protein
MKKLRIQSIAILNRLASFKSFLTITALSFIIGCNSDKVKKDDSKDYDIDLSVKYNNQINCFQIDKNGNAFVLIKETYKEDRYYKILFNEKEMQHIQNSLKEVSFLKCDTIDKITLDGTQYILNLSNKTIKRNVISGTCEELKPLNKLVKYIVESYRAKDKKEIFNSLKIITPPKLGNV